MEMQHCRPTAGSSLTDACNDTLPQEHVLEVPENLCFLEATGLAAIKNTQASIATK